jgi:hypothetical protein
MRAWIFVTGLLLVACASDSGRAVLDWQDEPTKKTLPCEISRIFQSKCWQCHGRPTQETAPMSLTTWEELHAPALERVSPPAPVYERVALRIHNTMRPMPPRDRAQLSTREMAALDAWLDERAPSGPACPVSAAQDASVPPASTADASEVRPDAGEAPVQPMTDASSPSTSGNTNTNSGTSTGMQQAPGTPPPEGSAGSPEPMPGTVMDTPPEPPEDTPVAPDESECTFIELRARQDNSGAPFQVPADALDLYQCFVYDQAFDAPTQALAIYPRIDNKSVVHHWLLYVTEEVDVAKITTQCGSFATNSMLLAGGGPGGGDWYMPKHVGVDLGKGKFILEVHYNNIGAQAAVDRSGARICTTRNLRPETAVISWLGNQLFTIPARANGFQVAGRCKPTVTKPIHLLRSWPHMHLLGTRMTMRVDRADGSSAPVFDVPFSFQAQKNVDANVVLQPGDSLLTTCSFDNPNDYTVGVGERASDEMCNNFVVAYPAGALTTDWFSLVNNACLGLP